MTVDRDQISQKMKGHYEATWRAGDAWALETSAFEEARYRHQLDLIGGRRYGRVLEIGCGSGRFTAMLRSIADKVVAMDIAEAAIERARKQMDVAGGTRVELLVADAMRYDVKAAGPWDLIVLSEAIYCLGWLYPMFDVAWFAASLFDATRDGGHLLLSNTLGHERDYLLRPWLIRTYRDLFLNIGYKLAREEVFRGTKEGEDFEVLMSLLTRHGASAEPTTLS